MTMIKLFLFPKIDSNRRQQKNFSFQSIFVYFWLEPLLPLNSNLILVLLSLYFVEFISYCSGYKI